MAQRIAVVSQKGGVGKTTVSLNLGLALAERNRRTLVVDLDPQGGVGHSLAKDDDALPGLADLVMGRVPAAEALLKTRLPNLSFLPRGRLSASDMVEFEDGLAAPGVLAGALSRAEGAVELTLMDAPSGLGRITRAALAVADWVLLPVQAEALALRSVRQVLELVQYVQERENPRLELLGILPTMVQKGIAPSMDVLLELWNGFGGLLETVIPRATIFLEASRAGLPVGFLGGRPSPEARRFDQLAAELDGIIQKRAGTEVERGDQPRRELL